ncbi:MAG TPA: DMT family transporter [Candidatus Aminicenantes bacterium]|nr:DMT family transporter [Candidatus Aminicenantes bacterium]
MAERSVPPSWQPPLVLALGIAAVSSAALFIRRAQAGAPSLSIAAYRLSLAALVLLPWASLRYRGELRRLARRECRLAGLAGLFLAVHFATWISSLEYTSVASSVVLVSTSPLWVALAGWLFLGEPLSQRTLAGLALAVAGGLVVGLGDRGAGAASAPLLGNGLALAGALAAAGYWLIGRRLRRTLSLIPYVALVYGAAAVILLALALAAGLPLAGFSAPTWGCFALLALLPQLLGHSSFNWALAHLPAAFVAVATLGEPIGATMLAFLVLGEAPGTIRIIGAATILAGILLALLPSRRGADAPTAE